MAHLNTTPQPGRWLYTHSIPTYSLIKSITTPWVYDFVIALLLFNLQVAMENGKFLVRYIIKHKWAMAS